MNVKIEYDRCNDVLHVETDADFRDGKCFVVGDSEAGTQFHAFCHTHEDIEIAIGDFFNIMDFDPEDMTPEFLKDMLYISECLPLTCEIGTNTECKCRCKNKKKQ